jgi:hypothetical protein
MKSILTRFARPLMVLALIFSTAALPACVARVQRRPVRAGVVVAPRRSVVVVAPRPARVRVYGGRGHGHGHHGHPGRGRGRGPR